MPPPPLPLGHYPEDDYIEIMMKEQRIRLYIVPGVSEQTLFEPKTRKEISVGIQYSFDIRELTACTENSLGAAVGSSDLVQEGQSRQEGLQMLHGHAIRHVSTLN